MEALGRVELPTNGLGNRCSIHLSYRADACVYRAALSLQYSPLARMRAAKFVLCLANSRDCDANSIIVPASCYRKVKFQSRMQRDSWRGMA